MDTTAPSGTSITSPTGSNPLTRSDSQPALQRPRVAGGRALALGGGGATGNAWEIGVIAGLVDAGIDVTAADLVIGTSAGSTAAVQICGATPNALLAAILAAPPPRPSPTGTADSRAPSTAVGDHLERTNRIIAAAGNAAQMRQAMGAAALALPAASDASAQQRWRAVVAPRLPNSHWPPRNVLITAVNAVTGDPVVFDRNSGVEVVDAVAASCASAFAYTIGTQHYIDGGYRRNENADLATGYGRVLVLSPFGGRSRHPEKWGMQLGTQVEELRAQGSRVEVVCPDHDAGQMFGITATDVSLRPQAARTGYNQGQTLAPQVGAFWLR